ncbi:protein phosphatase CheZ [Hydrogenothermus marinus]|uniref:Chemotaxis protein CheZ n=1 Tax=Hydrogenothermus marinus TaxID=133270 RepID=A0A3M0BJK2_9AQUI|nr:protein phosphatase CheZ [Hydrogenothermus marinus]RMA97510.1 chemotaxis protein CheZ [Hydrogenothermus marinus]
MEKKTVIEEIKNLLSLIESYKEEATDLNIKKEGFFAVKNHLKSAVDESKDAVETILNNINKTILNLEEILKLKDMLSDDNKEIKDKIDSLAKETISLLTDSLTKLEFQDIVGQRLNKVLSFIEDIEKSILKVLLILGIDEESSKEKKEELKKKLEEIEWKKEVSQDDVDDILKEFGL